MAARRAGAATASVGARIALLLLLYGALTCTDGAAAAAAAAIDAAPPLTAVLVHLHPPIDFAPQSLLSQQLREGQDEEKTAIKNAVGTRSESRERVHRVMSEFVRESQASVSALIRQSFQQAEGGVDGVVEVEHLWIQNALVVRVQQDGSVTETEQKRDDVRDFFERTLRWVPGVIGVEFDSAIVRLLDTIPGSGDDDGEHREASGGEKPQSNIELLHAPALWAQNVKGKGVVVANIDSGVRYTHESLRDNFRGKPAQDGGAVQFDYSFWFTPGTDMTKETPDTADMVGHGTHTMGTIVGGKGIGMAPEATWITARTFDIFGAANKSDFLLAAQWVLCPTKLDGSGRNCSLGADLISNSFGIDRSSPDFKDWKWMSDVVETWRTAGSYPVFASGNTNGFMCGSVYYPGSLEQSVAVGALVGGSSLWGASGKGPVYTDEPGVDGERRTSLIKPDLVAPGVGIRSALSVKDDSYTRLTGTSMATPHVAGAIALLLSLFDKESPSMAKLITALKSVTTRGFSKPFLVPSACGNTTYKQYPNNIYGWGMPNVCSAATELGFSCESWSHLDVIDAEVEIE
ncbi:Serine protease family s08a [Globisporangium polare]